MYFYFISNMRLSWIFVILCTAILLTAQESCAQWCAPGEVECFNSWECVPEEFVCDDYVDCENGWDEKYPTCPCQGFVCPISDVCIPGNYVCDDYPDCPDGEDEGEGRECAACFPCKADGDLCIPAVWVCDGARDCSDGSDELNCSNSSITVKKGKPLRARTAQAEKKSWPWPSVKIAKRVK